METTCISDRIELEEKADLIFGLHAMQKGLGNQRHFHSVAAKIRQPSLASDRLEAMMAKLMEALKKKKQG